MRGARGADFWSLLLAGLLLGCRGLAPRATPQAAPNRDAPSHVATVPSSISGDPQAAAGGACSVEATAPASDLSFAWTKGIARGSSGWVADIWADGRGVFAAGADSASRGGAQPFVASYDVQGRERFRVSLERVARSKLKPPRASAISIAGTPSGGVYALSAAVEPATGSGFQLTLLDATGRERFSAPLELGRGARVVSTPNADAIVIGLGEAGGLVVARYASNGDRLWQKLFPYEGGIPHIVSVADRVLLAGSVQGFAQLGQQKYSHLDTLAYRCAGASRACEMPGSALLVAELDANGNPLASEMFGGVGSSISISDLSALPDGRLLLTGEFYGVPTSLGPVTLCEAQPGMPAPEPLAFQEGSGKEPGSCDCDRGRRDLFLLELSRTHLPVWGKTLTLGQPQPRVGTDSAGGVIWAAQAADAKPAGTALALWALDASGVVGSRRSGAGVVKLLAVAPDRTVYLSDGTQLRRVAAPVTSPVPSLYPPTTHDR